jgi:hypothetical protein
MPTIAIKKNGKATKDTVGKVKDLSAQPLFVKKAKEAKEFLKKHGLPSTHKK